MESCPKCQLHLDDPNAAECPFCGVIFARLRPNRPDRPPVGHESRTPPAPGVRGEQARKDASRDVLFADAEAIARLYRRLVLLVGLQLLLGIFRAPRGAAPPAGATLLSLVVLLALIVLLGAIAVTTYKLVYHLGTGLPILWRSRCFCPASTCFFS